MKRITLFLGVILLVGCGSNTSVTNTYKAPEVDAANLKKVFVAAITNNVPARDAAENSIAHMFSGYEVSTVKSMTSIPPAYKENGSGEMKDFILKQVKEEGCDAILTVALVNKESTTRYVAGTNYYTPGYYSSFGPYFSYGYNAFYSPGYYTNESVYYIETNIYSATTEKLIWSAQSKTYNPASLDQFLLEYEKALSDQMVKDKILPKKQ